MSKYIIRHQDWYIIANKDWLQATYTDENLCLNVELDVDYTIDSYRLFANCWADEDSSAVDFDLLNDGKLTYTASVLPIDYDEVFSGNGKIKDIVIPEHVLSTCEDWCIEADAKEDDDDEWLDWI